MTHDSKELRDLANELSKARDAYLDAIGRGPGGEVEKLALQELLWNDKSTIIHALQSIASPAPQPGMRAEGEGLSLSSFQSWDVSITVDGDNILTLGSSHLSGRDDIDRYVNVVRSVAAHLISFISDPNGDLAAFGDAPPKPAPDVVREEIIRLAKIHVEPWLIDDDAGLQLMPDEGEIRDFADAVLKLFSAPVPPPDGAPDYESAARALGFLRMEETGNWIHPNYSDGLMRRYKSAEEIFNREVPDLFRPSDDVRSALAVFRNFAEAIPDNVEDAAGLAYAPFAKAMGTAASLTAGNFRRLLATLRSAPVSAPATVDVESLRRLLPRYASTLARNITREAQSDAADEQHDGGTYAIACWFDAVLALRAPAVGVTREAPTYDEKVEMLRLADDIAGAEIADLDTARAQIVTRALRIAGDLDAPAPDATVSEPIPRQHARAAIMTSRGEHLKWCKERALAILRTGDLGGACASMLSDLQKWDGGEMYDTLTLGFLQMDGLMFCKTPDQMKHWIEGFG